MKRACHRIYGVDVETDFPFRARLVSGAGKPDLVFSALEGRYELERSGCTRVYASAERSADGLPLVELWRQGSREWLRFAQRADFVIDRGRIGYSTDGQARDVETLFLSTVLAYFLERRGVLALHASSVAVGDTAIALVASSGTGKSSLAAGFVAAGHRLLTDDVAAVEKKGGGFFVRPGYPEMKLSPDIGRTLVGPRFEDLERVHPAEDKRRVVFSPRGARFAVGNRALGAILLLRRMPESGGVAKVLQAQGTAAVVELLKASFTPNLVQAAGLSEGRLERLSSMTEHVAVRYLEYPSGLDRLPGVVDVVARELAGQ